MQLKVAITQAGYGPKPTIKDISFDLNAGQMLAVIGPNGSGKTTLIRAISQVLPEVEGRIQVNGTVLSQASAGSRARLMAVVPQSTYVPPSFLVKEVVLMGRTPYLNWNGRATREDARIVEDVMEQTDITRFRNVMCGELSAGERQRVILARALAQDTPVLLMDEPTSHLDLRYQIEFHTLTQSLGRINNKTVLAAMHDLNLAARFGDLVLALKDGSNAAFGSVWDILQADTLSSIYGIGIEVLTSGKTNRRIITPA